MGGIERERERERKETHFWNSFQLMRDGGRFPGKKSEQNFSLRHRMPRDPPPLFLGGNDRVCVGFHFTSHLMRRDGPFPSPFPLFVYKMGQLTNPPPPPQKGEDNGDGGGVSPSLNLAYERDGKLEGGMGHNFRPPVVSSSSLYRHPLPPIRFRVLPSPPLLLLSMVNKLDVALPC